MSVVSKLERDVNAPSTFNNLNSKTTNVIGSNLTAIGGDQVIHGEFIVHGDLHGANVLVDDEGRARLTDFGMAIMADSTPRNYASIHGGGAVHWTAPELISPEDFNLSSRRPTTKSDIYSFACVCIEVSGPILRETIVRG